MRERGKRALTFACAVLLGAAAIFPVQASEISDAKKKQRELEEKLKESEEKKAAKEEKKSQTEQETAKLQSQLNDLLDDIESTERQMEEKQQELLTTQKALAEAVETESEQYEDMKIRIKYTYEQGDTSYAELFFTSKDIGDFLNKVEYVSEMSAYDRAMLAEYERLRADVAAKEQTVEREYAELEELEADLNVRRGELAALTKEKTKLIAKLEKEISSLGGESASYAAKVEEQKELVARLEWAEQQERAAVIGSGNGIYAWPLPASRRITSYFGSRISPTVGASSYHRGIDIGAPEGSDILAAADGRVDMADKNAGGAEGIWVRINHADGSSTVYMHCSKVCVSVGDKVKQGEKIAEVGSTGVSTGPHLHFGVMVGGTYVNPLYYL